MTWESVWIALKTARFRNDHPVDLYQLTRDALPSVFGDAYWMDTDDEESIAFYEYRDHEMQIEISLSGAIKRFILTNRPLMADPEQRESYRVDKPWPFKHPTAG